MISKVGVGLLPIVLVWSAWLLYLGAAPAISIVGNHIEIAATMLFGSFVAGSTSVGGGAVAFPVFTKVLGIPGSTALVFSLAIQSVGMTAASIMIWLTRTPIAADIIRSTLVFGTLGIAFGLFVVGPAIPAPDVRYLFSLFSAMVGVAMVLSRAREDSAAANVTNIAPLLLAVVSFLGGVLSGLIGTGIDFAIFAVMLFSGLYGLRVAIATSVIVMALNAIVGFTLLLAFTDRFSGIVIEYWLAAVPIVVLGAPLGALACRYLPRSFMFWFLLLLIVMDVVSTQLILEIRPAYLAAFALLSVCLVFYVRRRRMSIPSPQRREHV